MGSKVSGDELTRKRQELYNQRVEQYNKESTGTITTGINPAIDIVNTNLAIKVERLLTKLAASRKWVHGPGRGLTKAAESNLQAFKVRHVEIKYKNEWKASRFFDMEKMGRDA